jgi:hydroxyacylglutathione hydrolase
MQIFPIPAFEDNYIWTLVDGQRCVVVDPGDAAPVLRELQARRLTLDAIVITHWHPDHIGGIAELKRQFDVPVLGPAAEAGRIAALTRRLKDEDAVEILGRRFQVIGVPGHTLGHIAYYAPGTLLCGDTLFSAGCGRLFEGTPAQMHHSLSRLAALPGETLVYCTHEYTLANLAFARTVEPDNAAIANQLMRVRAMRGNQEPSLPTTLALEKEINPFLRTGLPAVAQAARQWSGGSLPDGVAVFTALRSWKDQFKAPAAMGTV